MSTIVDVYEAALREIAESGNDQAKAVLIVSRWMKRNSNKEIIDSIKLATDCLNEAIRANSTKWTKETDVQIGNAQRHLVDAIGSMCG